MSGVARMLDFSASFDSYNKSVSPEEADAYALFWDWFMTGQAVRAGIEQYKREPVSVEKK